MTGKLERKLGRSKKARAKRDRWAADLDECYEFCRPGVERFFVGGDARTDMDRVFDLTAPDATQNFGSRMMRDIMPQDARWFEFAAGSDIPKDMHDDVNRALADVSDRCFAEFVNSDFFSEATETMCNVAISTGALLVEEGDAIEPIRWTAYPLSSLYLDVGPHGRYDYIELPKKVRAGDIEIEWPQATLTGELKRLAAEEPDKEVELLVITERNHRARGEVWDYCVVSAQHQQIIYEFKYEGAGSCPWVLPGWSRRAGETYARGPAMIALPSIKTLNFMTEMELEALDWDITPMFQAEDDGVFNAETVQLAPGAIIPKAAGSKGLEPIQTKGISRNAYVKIEDLRQAIRRCLLDDDLGPVKGTPMSATEVMQRTTERANRLGGPYSRLWMEFALPVVQRVVYILKRRGDIMLPEVNGREIVLRPLSPLIRAQRQDDVLRFTNFIQIIASAYGPEMAAMITKPAEAAKWLAEVMAINPNILNGQAELKQMMGAIQRLANQNDNEPVQVAA